MSDPVAGGTETSEEEILRAIAEIGEQSLDHPGELRREQRLVEDLELDSIRLLTLAMEVEDRFEIVLDEDDEAAIATVGDLVDLVARKLAAKEMPAEKTPAEKTAGEPGV